MARAADRASFLYGLTAVSACRSFSAGARDGSRGACESRARRSSCLIYEQPVSRGDPNFLSGGTARMTEMPTPSAFDGAARASAEAVFMPIDPIGVVIEGVGIDQHR